MASTLTANERICLLTWLLSIHCPGVPELGWLHEVYLKRSRPAVIITGYRILMPQYTMPAQLWKELADVCGPGQVYLALAARHMYFMETGNEYAS